MSFSSTYPGAFPRHVAIIMDGNGRWAQQRRRPRVFGHQQGVKTVRRIVEDASELGIRYLTLYSFSTENWSRPKAEIGALFALLKQYVHDDLDRLDQEGVRIKILGSRAGLTPDILDIINKTEARTRNNNRFFLNIAFNYGGRDEILQAVQRAAKAGEDMENLSEQQLASYLYTGDMPDPDLVIRTSGEHRISNFLIWQAAYAELIFTDVLWPDFARADLEQALREFARRERRFGGVSASQSTSEVA